MFISFCFVNRSLLIRNLFSRGSLTITLKLQMNTSSACVALLLTDVRSRMQYSIENVLRAKIVNNIYFHFIATTMAFVLIVLFIWLVDFRGQKLTAKRRQTTYFFSN